ncbi:MAG: Na+/H+ antiporter subunit G [Kiritimatiellae bacterium]|nr:Na+/H+ antiporter subunit G [Kiritimatiellia bacterium]
MSSIAGITVIAVGILFDLFGCIGLIRLPDVYNRLQAATKCVTLGTCLVLVGVMIMSGSAASGIKAAICLAFILLTSPTAAHALARGAHNSGVKLWEKSVIDRYEEDKASAKRDKGPQS